MSIGVKTVIKPTFYNLPEEKRRRITAAIISEFSETSDEKVSINRIIHRAEISRGSFYQYFDDKVDLIEVLMKSFVEAVLENLDTAASGADNDIFSTYAQLFDIIASVSEDCENRTVLRRLSGNLRANDDLVFEYMKNRFKGIDEFKDCTKHFSREKLRFPDDSDFELLLQILTGILKNALFNYYVMEEAYEKVRRDYRRKLTILQAGALQSFGREYVI